MAGKRTKVAGQESLMEDVWSAVAAAEKEFGVVARVSLLRTPRKGVWRLRYDVFSVIDGSPHKKLVDSVREWPNGQAATLETCLFQMVSEGYNRLAEAIQVMKDQASF